jgi:hypothetical protein
VKFEDGLFISLLKNRAIRLKILQLEIEQLLKKSNVFKRRPTVFHTLPFSNSCVHGNRL